MGSRVVVPLDNTDNTVTRLVVKSVLEELVFSSQMDIEDIFYIPRGGKAATSQMYSADKTVKLEIGNHIQVEYKETYDPITIDQDVNSPEYIPIFRLPELDIDITPMHSRVNIEMTISYKNRSYNSLVTWLNNLRRQWINTNVTNYHEIIYNYTVPNDVLSYLYNVYVLTENIAPYGLTLQAWVAQNFTHGIMVRHNLDDSSRAAAINVMTSNCVGTYTQIPEVIETSKEPPMSSASFTYTLTYDRVTALALTYQKYIHNQVCGLDVIRKYGDRRSHQLPYKGHRTFTSSVNIAAGEPNLDLSNIFYDPEDTWHPDLVPASTTTVLIAPIQLDLNNLTDVVNLNDLKSSRVPQSLLTTMSNNSSCITKAFKSPIQIYLYEVGSATTMIPLICDTDLNVSTMVVLDPRKRYYLRIAMVTDLSMVDLNCSNLRRNGPDLVNIIKALDPTITVATIGNGAYVTDQGLNDAINWLNSTNHFYKVYYGTHRYFVVAEDSIIAKGLN